MTDRASGALGMTRGDISEWRRAHPKWFEFSVAVLTGVLIEIALIVFQPPALLIVRKFAEDPPTE